MDNRCKRYNSCPNNACNNKIVTIDCNPANKKFWKYPALPEGMNPVYYNVMNGCWLCNYAEQETENQRLCNRSFFNGVIKPPCNYLYPEPVNSNDRLFLAKPYK